MTSVKDDGVVVPLRRNAVPPPVVQDVSFEVALDEETGPAPVVHVDALPARQERRPIIPAHMRTVQGVKSTATGAASRTAYRAGYHAVRSPRYLLLACWWALVGVVRLIGRQLAWWWVLEQHSLRQTAASKGDAETYMKLANEARKVRNGRGLWLLTELAGLAAGVFLLLRAAPWWAPWVVLAAVVPLLAHFGRPVDKPILSAAVVTHRVRKLNADIVLRAYYSAGLGHPDKPSQQIAFGSTMSRDKLDTGSQVLVDLPYGTTFSDALRAREKIASGLDVAMTQVHLSPDADSNRRHKLYVADVDPLRVPAGRTPLLDCKPRDIWKAVPIGLDERGGRVLLPLIWTSVLIGAQPRVGKTFYARTLALFAALDPYVRLSVFDGKGSPDWRKFALVAFTYGSGLLPDRVQGDPIENLRATLRTAKQDVLQRNARLSELPTSICPEGKLTREIARDPKYGMPVWVIFLDEFQEFLSSGDEDADLEIAELLAFLVRVGPSVGLIMVSSTQKPSGLGSTGKVAKLFTAYRDNHQTRFALKTGTWQVSESILGSGSNAEGFDASSLPVGDKYKGIGILYDAPVPNATVRTYLADGADAERILLAARKLRERAGTLDGMAAGEAVVAQARDPLADSIDAFHGDDTFLSWDTLAGRLAEQQPEAYAETTGDALSKTLRGLNLGIESKTGAEKGRGGERPRGVYLANLRRALDKRRDAAQGGD